MHAYRDFVASVRRSFRYVRTGDQQAFLDDVTATVPARSVTMKTSTVLWRAQLGHDWRPYEEDGIFIGDFPTAYPVERMKPLRKFQMAAPTRAGLRVSTSRRSRLRPFSK
jgi:hypothetical protein